MSRATPLVCLITAASLSAALPLAGAIAVSPESGQAAVLFDPRLTRADLAQVAARAGTAIVRFGAAPGSMIVSLPESGGPQALRAAGAWLIADPVILGGCAPRTQFSAEDAS